MKKSCLQKLLLSVGFLAFAITSFAAQNATTAAPSGEVEAAKTSGYPQYPQVDYGSGAQAELIKKGEYLAKAGDCIACHTNGSNAKPFAGGLPIKTPFGTIYSSNITPDKETGIGNWTGPQFIRALRHGVSADGSFLFPVFPFVYYNKLSDDDALAIQAYLNAIPAVSQPNRAPDMGIPFRWRFLQVFWRFLFFDFQEGVYQYDNRQSPDWNRGKYLVEGAGHCGMCHSPLNFLGAEKKKYYLTGALIEGYFAPNITSATLANVSTQDIVNVFVKDQLIGGGNVQGPMLEVNHDSLKYLSNADLTAIATYLKTVKSATPPKPKGSNQGETIYNNYCQGCHTTGAGGAPKLGDQAGWAPFIQAGITTMYQNAIAGIDGMPAKGTCSTCTNAEIQAAVDYIVGKSKGAAGATVAGPVESPTSLAKGKEIYGKACAACHNQGVLGAPKIGDKAVWAPLIKLNMDVLFTRAINGYGDHPSKGACQECSDADIIAATKYMVQKSAISGDYSEW